MAACLSLMETNLAERSLHQQYNNLVDTTTILSFSHISTIMVLCSMYHASYRPEALSMYDFQQQRQKTRGWGRQIMNQWAQQRGFQCWGAKHCCDCNNLKRPSSSLNDAAATSKDNLTTRPLLTSQVHETLFTTLNMLRRKRMGTNKIQKMNIILCIVNEMIIKSSRTLQPSCVHTQGKVERVTLTMV